MILVGPKYELLKDPVIPQKLRYRATELPQETYGTRQHDLILRAQLLLITLLLLQALNNLVNGTQLVRLLLVSVEEQLLLSRHRENLLQIVVGLVQLDAPQEEFDDGALVYLFVIISLNDE